MLSGGRIRSCRNIPCPIAGAEIERDADIAKKQTARSFSVLFPIALPYVLNDVEPLAAVFYQRRGGVPLGSTKMKSFFADVGRADPIGAVPASRIGTFACDSTICSVAKP